MTTTAPLAFGSALTGHTPLPPPPQLPVDPAGAAWDKARAIGDIQYTPLAPANIPPSPPPHWLVMLLKWLAQWFGPIGHWLVVHWQSVEIAAAAVLVLIAASIGWRIVRTRRRAPRGTIAPAWQPDGTQAAVLLADADALAAAGRFGDAVHLLLRRSFEDIATTRPEWLTPASTAREIAALPALPTPARAAFGVMTGAVERSRYAMDPLNAGDWLRAREAYAGFAIADAPAR